MIDVQVDRFGRVRQVRRLRIPWALVVSTIVLALVAGGAALWATRLVESALHYRPALEEHPAPGDPTTPLTQQLVLIIVDGLRYDTSRQMPFLERLRGQGAHAPSIASVPSVSQPAWTTILTGAGPELNGAAPLNAPDEELQPIAVDDLFARARDMDLATGVAGHRWWSRMIPPSRRDVSFFPETDDPVQSDRAIAQAAVGFLQDFSADLLVVHFDQVDDVGHKYGATSSEYYEAAIRVDALIRQIANAMNLGTGVLVVTADHGHLDQGGHGGGEPEVVTTPFVAVGPGLRPGAYEAIRQTDVAPTIAALLGTALPALNQGRVRFEMLDMPWELRAEKALALTRQRLAVASAYLRRFDDAAIRDMLREEAETIQVAEAAMVIGNFDSTYRLLMPTLDRLDAAMEDAREAGIERERFGRLSTALAAILAPWVMIWWRRSPRLTWMILGALLAFFFPLGNLRLWAPTVRPILDLDAIVRQATLALALGVVVVLAWLWWHGDRRAGQFLVTVFLGGLIVAPYFGLLSQPEGTYTASAIQSMGPFARTSFTGLLAMGKMAFTRELAGRVLSALGLGGLIVLLGLWWERERNLWAVARATHGFVLLLVYLLLIPLAVCYWRNGPLVTWYLPEAGWGFLHLTTLLEMALVAAMGLVLPIATVTGGGLLRWLNVQVLPRVGVRGG